MKDILQCRKEIDEVDKQLVKLFERRLNIVYEIFQYKKQNKIPIEDKNREKEVVVNNLKYLNNNGYTDYVEEFLKTVIKLSKKMQINLLEDEDL